DQLRPLHEMFAQALRDLGLRISQGGGIVAKDLELASVELAEPALDYDPPDRVPAVIAAHDTDAQPLSRTRRRRELNRRMMRRHGSTHEPTKALLQIAITAALIGEEERQIKANDLGEARPIVFDLGAEVLQLCFVGRSPFLDLSLGLI